MSVRSVVFVVVASFLAPVSTVSGQTDPRTLPRWNPASIRQEAAVRFPGNDGNGVMTNYGGAGVGVSEDGRFLYASCMQALANGADQRRGQIVTWNLPAPGGTATVAAPCRGLTMAQLASVHPDPSAYKPMMGGILDAGGRLLISAFITYDANAGATKTFFSGASLTTLAGPYAPPSGVKTGIVKSYMGRIPAVWQALLGGKAFATAGYSSIVGRASYGESFIAFNPEDATRDGFPMFNLMSCPVEIAKCQARYGAPTNLLEYNGSEIQGGAMIIPGTRTLAYIVRESEGPSCYGYATRDQALHGTPYPTAANPSPENVPWCYSLSDPLNEKGPKGYPYTLGVRLYDLADLVAVKQGTKAPHDVAPYDFVKLPNVGPGVTLGYAGGGAFNETNGCWYQTAEFWPGAGDAATVPVYCGFGAGSGTPPPPPPPPTGPTPVAIPDAHAMVAGGTLTIAAPGVLVNDQNAVEAVLDTVANHGGTVTLRADGSFTFVSDGTTGVTGFSYRAKSSDGQLSAPAIASVAVTQTPPPPPPPTEICGDGIDNDGDGLVDEGCPPVPVEICGDGVDNDYDGKIDEGCESAGAVPGEPHRLYGSVKRSSITLKWFPPLTGGTVEEYVLEAGLSPGETFYVAPVGLSTVLNVPNVGNGRYYVRVRGRNANGLGPASNEVTLSVGCRTRPSRLSGLTATTRGTLVSLRWTDPDGCSGTTYQVAVGSSVLSTEEPSTTTVLPQGTYVARVVATADTGVSDVTDVRFTVSGGGCAAPRFRTMLRPVVAGRRVGLFWSPLEPDVASEDDRLTPVSYLLEAGTAPGATDIAVVPMARAAQFITDAPAGTYYVRIRPANACGTGSASNEAKLVVK